jgi:long-chain acyl-CoA synthetase
MQEIFEAIARHASEKPAALAVSDDKGAWTYGELRDAIAAFVDNLRARCEDGLRPIATRLPNSAAWAVVDLALSSAGFASVPIADFYTEEQLSSALADAGAGWIVEPAQGPDAFTVLGSGLSIRKLEGNKLPIHPGTAKISYTSGSTSAPKGVCLSAALQQQVAASIVERYGAGYAGVHVPVLSLGVLLENVAGLYPVLLAGGQYKVVGASSLGLTDPFRPDFAAMRTALAQAGATSTILVPELLRGLMSQPEIPVPDMRLIAVGGSKMASELVLAARKTGLPVYEGYGLTECGSVVAVNAPDLDCPGSCGKPLSHVNLCIAEDGEVIVNGPSFLGYTGQPAHNGDVHTGDLGEIDGEGFLSITGRKKNVIITSFGRNVSPEWIESELLLQPEFAQAVVLGDGEASLSALLVPSSPVVSPSAAKAAVDRANARLPAYARLNSFRLAPPLTPASGLVTANGRPRREAISTAYQSLVPEGETTI